MQYKPVMILGCTSSAGKSFLVTALCRYAAQRGIRVAPFKAQNMSNNAAVTPEGLEIGRAQYLQALAARVTPQARMNPVLLKPSADTCSQVIVLGRVDPAVSAMAWETRREALWPCVKNALHSLIAEYELVLIEGAGSPAEINLRSRDIVNMSVALECKAEVYLVADIDRGGAFAHLLGTWLCLAPEEQALIKGFVLNRFRGEQRLLGNAMDWLKARTGVPTVAIVPSTRHHLPEEDTLRLASAYDERQINIALIAYPYASNFDEFDPLAAEGGVNVAPIREATVLDRYHAIILPGSKNTVASLRHVRETGLAAEISRAAQRGVPVLGICGGLQMLGQEIKDPHHLEDGDMVGLGLLDVTTTLMPHKITTQRDSQILPGGARVKGYEIHHGQTTAGPSASPCLTGDLGWRQGNVMGVYLHGILENTVFRVAFLKQMGWTGTTRDWQVVLDAELDRVACLVEDTGWSRVLGW